MTVVHDCDFLIFQKGNFMHESVMSLEDTLLYCKPHFNLWLILKIYKILGASSVNESRHYEVGAN
jgi:hypothetical protein